MKTWRRTVLLAVCAALLFSGMPRAAGKAEALPDLAEEATPFGGLPEKYDLRETGVVTPVKLQWPWGSCWSFGTVAAAEISILSALGRTYAEYPLDLSEKHAAWFARHPITERDDPAQAGEGTVMMGAGLGDRPEAACYNGGNAYEAASLFAMGYGPALEADFPYRGAEGILERDVLEQEPEKWKETYLRYHPNLVNPDSVLTEEEQQAVAEGKLNPYMDDGILARVQEKEALVLEEAYRKKLAETATGTYLQYAQSDDWTLPETDGEGKQNRSASAGFVMTDYNTLPPLNEEDGAAGTVKLNPEGMRAAKQEMLNGRGVIIDYYAEAYSPAGVASDAYYNRENSAHYTYDNRRNRLRDGNHSNHVVCIVGWDDHYPAENFTHEVHGKDAEGNPAADPERSAKTTPPGDGAWLIKNSRGSETDAVADGLKSTLDGRTWPEHYSLYGLTDAEGRHTGYDWISYYDVSLGEPSSLAFEGQIRETPEQQLQYDYLPNSGAGMLSGYWESGEKPLSMANVFTAGEDGEITGAAICTPRENCRVTWRICLLPEGAENPEEGTVACISENHPYPGYHRITLPKAVPVRKGQRFSLIADVSFISPEGKRTYIRAVNTFPTELGNAVVNPGESFAKTNGAWEDWADLLQSEAVQSRLSDDFFENKADNFPIKAFVTLRTGTEE